MSERPSVPGRPATNGPSLDGAFTLVIAGVAVLLVLVILAAIRGGGGQPPSGAPTASPGGPAAFLYPDPRPAPPLALTDESGRPFDNARLRGEPALVFFGYTHCPDVCPATMGIVTEVSAAFESDLRVVFVSIDPERDTVPWLAEYVRFLPDGFTALTGSPADVRAAADAWGVRYARVDTGDPAAYSMSHTAEVYLVDAAGTLRAHFPFGTQAPPMLETLRSVATTTPSVAPSTATPGAPPSATPAPAAAPIGVEVVSTSVWAGGASPVILALVGAAGRVTEVPTDVGVEIRTSSGEPVGHATAVTVVQPPGVATAFVVATVDIPDPGWWRLEVTATLLSGPVVGSIAVTALDPGASAPLGADAPDARTPTLDDVGGVALRVTTDYLPDLRFSEVSTTDALARGEPFVLVVDSARFKVSPACGRALQMSKFLLDRWPSTTFIHLEPYAYTVESDTAVLEGSLSAPTLVPAAAAWGIGGAPWGAASMPWVFAVDGDGTVVAKYQGVVGSDDVDVILAMLFARS